MWYVLSLRVDKGQVDKGTCLDLAVVCVICVPINLPIRLLQLS